MYILLDGREKHIAREYASRFVAASKRYDLKFCASNIVSFVRSVMDILIATNDWQLLGEQLQAIAPLADIYSIWSQLRKDYMQIYSNHHHYHHMRGIITKS